MRQIPPCPDCEWRRLRDSDVRWSVLAVVSTENARLRQAFEEIKAWDDEAQSLPPELRDVLLERIEQRPEGWVLRGK